MPVPMSSQPEFLPATASAQQHIVLLHGWGSSREIWRPLVTVLRPWANITLLDIPGLAPGEGDSAPVLEEVLDDILLCAPQRAVYLGWSLGGQLAMLLAQRAPQRVVAAVTLCSNPHFTAKSEWPGLPAEELGRFLDLAAKNPAKALRRFDSLQVTGAGQPRQLRRALQSQRKGEPGAGILQGLRWLADLDLRSHYPAVRQPQLHLLGERDELVSADVVPAVQGLLENVASASVVPLENCSHLAPLEAADDIAASVLAFLHQHQLLGTAPCPDQSLAKQDIAHSFSKAAPGYDSVAMLQRDVGSALLARLDSRALQPERILDLGSGTGYFFPPLHERFPAASYLGLDLAEGMVAFSREQHPQAGHWMVGDAESLPLAAGSIDLVFSSLALQWSHRPELLCAELARVLRPGGVCVFTSLGPGTLRELRAAWAAVDQHQHVNHFLPVTALEEAVARCPGMSLSVEVLPYRMHYRRAGELLHELKTLGAHNVNRQRPSGLTGRQALQGMMAAYEEYRENGLLPASYDVIFGVVERA